MKRLISVAAVLIMAVPVIGQAKDYATQGVWEMGGSAGYSSLDIEIDDVPTTDVESTTLSLMPEVGYFVMDNLSIGVMIDYSKEKMKYGALPETTETSTSLFLAPTYVFKQEKMFPYVGVLLGMQSSDDDSAVIKTSAINYGVRGGVKVQVGDSGLLNVGLVYITGSGEWDRGAVTKPDFDSSQLKFTAGFTLFL